MDQAETHIRMDVGGDCSLFTGAQFSCPKNLGISKEENKRKTLFPFQRGDELNASPGISRGRSLGPRNGMNVAPAPSARNVRRT